MKLAAIGSKSVVGDVQQNLFHTKAWVQKLDRQRVDFVLFPELNVSGYTKDVDTLNKVLAEKEIVFRQLLQCSTTTNMAFAFGFPEQENSNYYITHYLLHKGTIIGKHRKTHLSTSEKEVFSEGDAINVFAVGDLKIGIQLCYETHFPEISYMQAAKGANVLAMAFASPNSDSEKKLERFKRFLPARAYDNTCFVVACNLNSETQRKKLIPPLALLINPKGEVLQETTDSACVSDIDLQFVAKIKQSSMGFFNEHKRINLFRDMYPANGDK